MRQLVLPFIAGLTVMQVALQMTDSTAETVPIVVTSSRQVVTAVSSVTPVPSSSPSSGSAVVTPAVCTSLSNNVAHKEIWEPITPTNATPCTFVMNRPEASMLGVNSSQAFRMEEMADVARKTQLECLNAFSRIPGPRGGDFDVFQSGTEASVAPAHTPSIQWCASTAQWRGCRQCGYSCNNLEAAKGGYIDVGIKYPILRTVGVYVSETVREYNATPEWNVTELKATFNTHNRRLLSKPVFGAPKAKPVALATPNLILFGDESTVESALTAERMGFKTRFRPVEEFNSKAHQTRCAKVHKGLTFFFSRRFRVKDVQRNIGRWLHDNYFPMFSIISRYVNLTTAAQAHSYRVVPYDNVAMQGFKQSWAVGPLAHLLEALLPRRSNLYQEEGRCYAQAVFDCAPANSMEPMQPLHRWLRNVHKMDFTPLAFREMQGETVSAAKTANTMLLMLRKRGTVGFIQNHRALADVAKSIGWNVTVPLDPDLRKGSIQYRMLDVLEHLQTCALMVGFHGNELATMFFMPRGSVVVEIVSVYFRYLDAWYIRQAKASSLHLVRWTPSNESISFGPKWRAAEAHTKTDVDAPGTFSADVDEWRALLSLSSSLLKLPVDS